jgi:hypothetical protein
MELQTHVGHRWDNLLRTRFHIRRMQRNIVLASQALLEKGKK